MSYIYSQALVAASLPGSCLDTEPSVPSSGNPTHKPCLWHDKTMAPSHLSRFGMMCRPLTDTHGAALLASWQAGFRARTSAQQAKAQGLTEPEAACGTTWPASLARLDPASSLWKTHQHSLLEGLEEFSETWPRWGLMRNGECWERATLAHRTSESASGSWQTPVADDSVNRVKGKWNSQGEPKLSAQVMFPTPLANSHTGAGHGPNKKGSPNLQTVVAMWPTPVATMSKGSSPAALTRKNGQDRSNDRLDHAVMASDGGQLNPDWVEWLMGWPIGHTDLKPLATARYQEWQQQHSIY